MMASSSVPPVNTADEVHHDDSATATTSTMTTTPDAPGSQKEAIPATATEITPPPSQTQAPTQTQPPPTHAAATGDDDDDDESDFDELDEVLDDFKPTTEAPTNALAQQSTTTASAPADSQADIDFMKQLEQDMARMMGQAAQESGATENDGFESAVNEGADAFTKQLEESGIPPGDFLKQLLADVMAEEGIGGPGEGSADVSSSTSAAAATAAAAAAGSGESGAPESFNDAIQRTINRMKESGDKATAAAEEDNSDDLVAQLLKAIEAGADGAGDDGDLTKMFMGMMEQLSNKDMLYEPMKELDTKFGPWIKDNKGKEKVSAEDMARYEKQATLVSQIVAKFEDPKYTDEDSKCREYVWEKMQEMQAAGNPPDELVANPWMDDMKGGAPAGMPDCPQQ